jgi:HlyD family secretion protein
MQDLMQKAGIGGGGRGGPGGGGRRGGNAAVMINPLDLKPPVVNGFSEEDRKAANLPKPPEEDSQVQALLRPGLLADVEITVEKIPNALHVPAQAVFEKGGKPTVFVQKNGKFEPREVQLMKRSETMMVLAGGVQPGEVIAMADPTADKSDKKGKAGEKKSGSGAMGAMPAGGKQ